MTKINLTDRCKRTHQQTNAICNKHCGFMRSQLAKINAPRAYLFHSLCQQCEERNLHISKIFSQDIFQAADAQVVFAPKTQKLKQKETWLHILFQCQLNRPQKVQFCTSPTSVNTPSALASLCEPSSASFTLLKPEETVDEHSAPRGTARFSQLSGRKPCVNSKKFDF